MVTRKSEAIIAYYLVMLHNTVKDLLKIALRLSLSLKVLKYTTATTT